MKNKGLFTVFIFGLTFLLLIVFSQIQYFMIKDLTKEIDYLKEDLEKTKELIPTAYAEEIEARACPAALEPDVVLKGENTDKIEELEPKESESGCISLGQFYVTAYCGCPICCGEWALNRPKDENGNDIVYGSSGRVLVPGYSIAVDPEVIPLGTIVRIDGKEYRADDTGGLITGNRIDVYFITHEEALNFKAGNYQVDIWR